MSNYTRSLVDRLRQDAHQGKMIDFGYGGALIDWLGRGAWHIESEGYGNGGPLDSVTADLPEPPEGCDCEGCREHQDDAARRLLAAAKAPAPGRVPRRIRWRNCVSCNALSPRAGFALDGLCPSCYAERA